MASTYGWVVTYDHLDHERVSVYGPRDISDEHVKLLNKRAPETRTFKMYDDDGNLYYSGRYVGPDGEDMFGPLEDYGTPNAGATEIRYRDSESSKYVTL